MSTFFAGDRAQFRPRETVSIARAAGDGAIAQVTGKGEHRKRRIKKAAGFVVKS